MCIAPSVSGLRSGGERGQVGKEVQKGAKAKTAKRKKNKRLKKPA
jgi:hypothetical protein